DHPELGEVPARLRLLGAERRSERIDLSERGRGGLTLQLPGLREIRVPFVEVLRGKQPASLTDGRGENRCVDSQKSALVEKIADRLFERVANDEDCALSWTAQPEVTVIE